MRAIILALALLFAVPAVAAEKHTILFFTATWCGPCQQMKHDTLPRVSLPGHTLKLIDVDENPRLSDAYRVSSIPAYIVLDGQGRPYRRGEGFRDVPQFVRFLNEGK